MCKVWLNCDKLRLDVTTSQSVGEGQGNTHTDDWTDRQKNLIGQTCIISIIETTPQIGLIFS